MMADICTITHSVKYRLVIIIEKNPPKYRDNFFSISHIPSQRYFLIHIICFF